MKYVNEGKVDDGYYIIDNGIGVQIHRYKGVQKCDSCTQTNSDGI